MVRGIQSQHIAATVKHFACNNKETNRKYSDSRLSQRALREIYLKAFEIIVREEQPWAIMSSYNVINGRRASESRELLTTILREEWGFDGAVISDWGGVHNTKAAAACSMDLEMSVFPDFDEYELANPLKELIEKGEVSEDAVDAKVRTCCT